MNNRLHIVKRLIYSLKRSWGRSGHLYFPEDWTATISTGAQSRSFTKVAVENIIVLPYKSRTDEVLTQLLTPKTGALEHYTVETLILIDADDLTVPPDLDCLIEVDSIKYQILDITTTPGQYAYILSCSQSSLDTTVAT